MWVCCWVWSEHVCHVGVLLGVVIVRHQSLLANSGRPYGIALHAFQGTQSGDLTFDKGELIELLGNKEDSAWIKGRLGSAIGIFPSKWVNYLMTCVLIQSNFVESFVEILRYPEESVAMTSSPDTITRRIPNPRVSLTKPHPLTINEGVDGSTSPVGTEYSPHNARQTPVRSAPLPHSMRPTSRSTSDIRTISSLPQPRPRRPRPRHTSADASLSSSSSSSQLESELTVCAPPSIYLSEASSFLPSLSLTHQISNLTYRLL